MISTVVRGGDSPGAQASPRALGGGRVLLRRIGTLLVALASLMVPASRIAVRADDGKALRVIGSIPFGANVAAAPEMLVDSRLHRGYTQAFIDGRLRLVVYDLERLAIEHVLAPPATLVMSGSVVDETNGRVFFVKDGPFAFQCGSVGGLSEILILDQRSLDWTTLRMPCIESQEFLVRSLLYTPKTDTLYAFGAPSAEQLTEGVRPDGKQMRFRAMDPETLEVKWDANVGSGCDNGDNRPYPDLIARFGDALISYCYRSTPGGLQGLSLRIPLEDEAPRIVDGRPYVESHPTLPQRVAPFVDPVSGRMIIFTSGPPNGQAAWVFDPASGLFHGVIPSGVPNPPGASLFLGFDRRSGRLYILNARGIVIADIRHRPLPTGVPYRVLDDVRDNNSGLFIAVDTSLKRLFVPVLDRGWVVVQDDVPQPADPPAPDPDRGTADIPEVAGQTDVTHSGAAHAFGVHLLSTGGAPRAIDQYDPLCNETQGGLNDKDEAGRCPADRLLTPGNREYFFSETRVEAGADSGVSALGAPGRSPSTDSATDADFRSLGRCETDKLPQPEGAPSPETACPSDAPVISEFRSGTQGRDGKGFPVRVGICNDFDGTHAEDHPTTDGVGSADVVCDYRGDFGESRARSAALAIPDVKDPLIAIGGSWTSTTSRVSPAGRETIATATVTGVVIAGELRIGRITTRAITAARGRSGTTRARFEREYADVEGPGISCDGRCDPQQVVDAINQILGPSVRARLPQANELATPRGYQGVIVKARNLYDSDRTINDDDTQTVNGLDVIVYNDGKNGRSRLVIGMAGVQAESRYGIFPLAEGGQAGSDQVVIREPFEVVVAGPPAPGVESAPAAPPAPGFAPVQVVSDTFALIRTQPREFFLLFAVWSLFAVPIYLGLRRRSFARALGER